MDSDNNKINESKTQKNIGKFIEEIIDLENVSHVLSERKETVSV
jgi:hypothetical protein